MRLALWTEAPLESRRLAQSERAKTRQKIPAKTSLRRSYIPTCRVKWTGSIRSRTELIPVERPIPRPRSSVAMVLPIPIRHDCSRGPDHPCSDRAGNIGVKHQIVFVALDINSTQHPVWKRRMRPPLRRDIGHLVDLNRIPIRPNLIHHARISLMRAPDTFAVQATAQKRLCHPPPVTARVARAPRSWVRYRGQRARHCRAGIVRPSLKVSKPGDGGRTTVCGQIVTLFFGSSIHATTGIP